jgi:indole-3-glycerol phosphate synthase
VTRRSSHDPTYLSGIVAAARERAEADRRDPERLVAEAMEVEPPRPFAGAITQTAERNGVAVIAEIKRRSPSKGDLAPDLDPSELGGAYERGGAACLSVLTDEAFFGGSATDLQEARTACALPALRKDFTVCESDLADARTMGADAVLLIVAALTKGELGSFVDLARKLSLDALVEVHDESELDTALTCGATLVGVNQRDLHTFRVDTDLAPRLATSIPDSTVAVAESGITGPDDVSRLGDAGYQAVLVGESLVTSNDPAGSVRRLTGHPIGPRHPARTVAGG